LDEAFKDVPISISQRIENDPMLGKPFLSLVIVTLTVEREKYGKPSAK
jgi:hypothetical protein